MIAEAQEQQTGCKTREKYTVEEDPKTSRRKFRVNPTTLYRLVILEEAEQQELAARADGE